MQVMQSMDTALKDTTDRIRAASADGTPLRIRGGGSKDFYGNRLHGELLDTRGLSGVISYEPTELVVTVGAGTPLAELETLLAERGQCLPFEPPHFSWSGSTTATVGGMVAAGLSGPARASAGAVREYVLGLHMVNGLGQELVFGGQVMKNVAGYDVSRMMVGSMGTLGLITEVSLKVLPVAPLEATLVFPLDQTRALECLHRWGGQPLPLNASCWVHDDTASAGPQDLLFVRLRGAVAAVEAACKPMQTQLAPEYRSPPRRPGSRSHLRKCVHCGFCTATCPTYQLLGDELDGPRGRIYLIKQVLEGQAPTRKTQMHLDRCPPAATAKAPAPAACSMATWSTSAASWWTKKCPALLGEKACAGR
jgi:glycolate oxidase FAD binding subunit